jgi:hypothetical protein
VPPPALAELVAAGDVLDDWLAALTQPPGESRLGQWLARGEQTLGLLPTTVHRDSETAPLISQAGSATAGSTTPPPEYQ